MPKVRILFAHELIPEGESEPRLLKVDEKHDLPKELADRLIAEGRAELVLAKKPEPTA